MRALVVAAVMCLVPAVAAAERPKLAVLDLDAKGVDKATVETLTEIVTVALKKLGVFDVISRADIQQMLNFEESKQLVGCTSSSSCIAEIGGALGVARVVTGSVGKLGKKWVLTLSLIDTKSAKVIERESREAETEEALVAAAENGSRYLVRSLLEGKRGDVILKVSETSAEVEVDGKLVGLTPMPRMQLASGPHTLRVSKKGFISFAKDVIVDEREATVFDITLIPSAEFIADYDRVANGYRIAAYTVGAAGVGMIVAGALVYSPFNSGNYTRLDADRKDYLAGKDVTVKHAQAINAGIEDLKRFDQLSIALMACGGAVIVTGVVLFFAGPKPGIYDSYKTVSIGDAKVSFDLAPYKNGAFGSATLRY